jgi:hypothetical protein
MEQREGRVIEEPEKGVMQLEFVSHMACDKEHYLMHRVVGTDIYRQTTTKFRNGKSGKSEVIWFHKNDKDSHMSYEQAAEFKPC